MAKRNSISPRLFSSSDCAIMIGLPGMDGEYDTIHTMGKTNATGEKKDMNDLL